MMQVRSHKPSRKTVRHTRPPTKHRTLITCRKGRRRRSLPKVLLCAPEISSLPGILGDTMGCICAKGGGLGDVVAGLAQSLLGSEQIELHLAVPKFDLKMRDGCGLASQEIDAIVPRALANGIHLVNDSAFATLPGVYDSDSAHPPTRRAEAFQRYVINHLFDEIQPDVVHCHDWMTGLIPAAAHDRGIMSLFTVHNVFTQKETLANLDRGGIDVRRFERLLYFERFPDPSPSNWTSNRVDFAATGIHAADWVNTVSETFLREIVEGAFDGLVPAGVARALCDKHARGRATGILNAPKDDEAPGRNRHITRYGIDDVGERKGANKREFQRRMGLRQDPDAPLFLWPSRLFPQKGPELLSAIASDCVIEHGLQIGLVADGDDRTRTDFAKIAVRSDGRVSIRPFREDLSALGKAGADFVLMPSFYEPCGLPQMECPRFGTLPVARETGGLRDTVRELDCHHAVGNGFLFRDYDSSALEGAIGRAVRFHRGPRSTRLDTVRRVMRESRERFTTKRMGQRYLDVYERLAEDRHSVGVH